MGRPIRVWKSDEIYFVTNRCHQQKFLFRPGEDVNAIILSILASVADKYDVEIFAFVFMSNHFHMIIRCRSCRLSEFMGEWQGQLAKRLNQHWERPGGGSFYEGRFKAAPILDDAELLDKLRYTLCNPCESNLVSHPMLWPGLSSWSVHKSGEPLVGKRVNKKEYWRLRRKHEDMSHAEAEAKATVEYPLEMAKLPMWADLGDDEYRKKVCQEVCDHAEHLADQPTKRCLGVKKVLSQSWDARPKNPKQSTCPLCHTSVPELRQAYKDQHRDITDRYRQAVGKLRKGYSDVEFPMGTIPPGRRDCVGTPKPRDSLRAA